MQQFSERQKFALKRRVPPRICLDEKYILNSRFVYIINHAKKAKNDHKCSQQPTMPRKKKSKGISRGSRTGVNTKEGKKAKKKNASTTEEAEEAKIDKEPFPTPEPEPDDDDCSVEEEEVETPTTQEQRLEAFFQEQECEVEHKPILNQMAKRLAVAYLFINIHGAPKAK
jgi:hypothetical protein